jgi:anti-sigma factor RsiW
MHSCQDLDPLVTPYIDGALADDDRRAVEAHLHACPPCHSRIVAERAVHQLIRERQPELNAVRAPEALRASCAKIARLQSRGAMGAEEVRVAPAAPPRAMVPPLGSRPIPAAWKTRLTPYALAASLVVVVGGAFVYQATDQSAKILAAQLTADHVKCFAANAAFGTRQSAATVESSMLSSFGWAMHLPQDAAREGLELVGARQCLYSDGRVAHIMYRHEGHPVSLFMLPKTARTQELVDVLGHEAAIWCVGNRTFVLLSRQSKREIEQLASFVQAGLH